MEQNLPVFVKKVWSLVRVVYFMLRKSISKRKLLLEINMMIKRGKIVGKALQNLMFHHHNNWAAFSTNRRSHHSPPLSEFEEFSCTASPFASNYTFSNNKPRDDLDMMICSEMASPALSEFGRSPVVRELRVTKSPYPLGGRDEDHHVDEAAEQFISRFYNDLRQQNTKLAFGSS